MTKVIIAILLFLLAASGWSSALAQDSTTATVEVSDAQKRKESFELVWNTVNERFYDPAFRGVDWKKVRERYAPLVAAATTDQQLHRLLQEMIGELHQSHFLIIPKESIPKLIPKRNAEAEAATDEASEEEELAELESDESTTPLDRIGYKLTERLSTGIGIDLRIIKGQAVISHVQPGSAAARAGLRPGFVIKTVGERSLATVISQFESNTTFQAAFRGELPLILLAAFINGERQSPVKLSYLDAANRARRATIRRERLQGEMSTAIGNLPAMYTEFESRTLPGGFGYIRFNAFMPILMKKVCAALRAHHEDRGLILDLRGNQGGLLGMVSGLSGLLQTDQSVVGIMQSRAGRGAIMAYPQRMPYSGPLVILVDGSTQSAAEMFTSGLQDNGRAVVIGQRSAGNTLPSTIMKLPTGALFQYAFANYVSSNGQSLEGRGIVPDITVELSRRTLLTGHDPQLNAAVRKLRELTSGPKELIADVSGETLAALTESDKDAGQSESKTVTGDIPKEVPAPPVVTIVVPSENRKANGLPTVDEVIDHYLTAIGGRGALEKLNSRVSRGRVELQSMGLTGTAEIYELAPDKSTMIINVDGMGTIQQTYDGAVAWLQDPLDGYIRFAPTTAARIRNDILFQRELRFKEINSGLKVVAKEKVDNREVFVVSATSSAGEFWYFDVKTGLLVRKGNTSYDDYREVDGVKLPFKVTDNTSYGFGVVVRLDEIKHNVPIDSAKFAESPDCFTKPEIQVKSKKEKVKS